MKRLLHCACPAAGLAPARNVTSDPVAALVPPTWADRRHVLVSHLFGPRAVLETVPGTLFDTARGFPRQWGRGGTGFTKRLGSQYGQFVVGEGIEMGVSALHKGDPRYVSLPDERFSRRLRHALGSTVVVRGADGSPAVGLARLANLYGSWTTATRGIRPANAIRGRSHATERWVWGSKREAMCSVNSGPS